MAEHGHITATPDTSRRRALTLAAGAFSALGITAGVAASAPQPHPDAELIALCAQFDALERRLQAAVNGAQTIGEDEAAEAIASRLRKQQDPVLARICALSPATSAGLTALARSLVLWDGELYIEEDDPNANTNERLLAALLRGVAPPAAAFARPLPAGRRYDRHGGAPSLALSDADFIAICDQHLCNRAAINSNPDIEDEDPRWDAYNATADAISVARPMTLDGMAAKARVVMVEATQPDGTENLEAMSLDWAWDLINDVLRIGGRA